MPRGDKSSYTDKQKRQAAHIEKSYRQQGKSRKTAEARAWATVNKLTGGGKKSGSGSVKPGVKGKTQGTSSGTRGERSNRSRG